MVASQSSSVMLLNPPVRAGAMPTLLTRMSIRSPASAISWAGPAGSARSTASDLDLAGPGQLVELGRRPPGPGDDPGPVAHQPTHHGQPDPPARPGDHRDPPVQAQVHGSALPVGAPGCVHPLTPTVAGDRHPGHRRVVPAMFGTGTGTMIRVAGGGVVPDPRRDRSR